MLEPLLGKLNDLRIILASSSQQRKVLLASTHLKFDVIPSKYEENLDPARHSFSDYVEKTALGKVDDVVEQMKNAGETPDLVIGVDTMVAYNGKMYGKPKDKNDAFRTIKDLTQANLPNLVYSGVVLWYRGHVHKFTEVTTVYMMQLNDEEIFSYVETGEPMGKAGGYGIQGIASTFVKRIDGDGNNVIGLPLCRLVQELKQLINN